MKANLMTIFQSIILGIVQGLTEFLPISSTAHLRIVPALFHWKDPGTAYSAVIQLGTMLSVIIYFWKDLAMIYGALVSEIVAFCRGEATLPLKSYESKLGFWILLGTIPICIFGLLLKEPIEQGFLRNLNIISFYLIFFGILLFSSELIAKETKTLSNINALDVLLIGLVQSFALIPGVSRSGVTLLAGLFVGFKRSHAARFSFLLSVPAVLLSGVFELRILISDFGSQGNNGLLSLTLGVFFALISGYFTIDFLLKYLQTHKTHVFVVYRVFLGLLVIYLNCRGIIR